MRHRLISATLTVALSTVLMAACAPDRGSVASETDARAPDVAEKSNVTPVDAATPDATPAPLPAPDETGDSPVSNDGNGTQARFDGYGDVMLGIVAADMRAAWGGELKEVGKEFNAACYFLTPAWVKVPAEFAFMVADGKFVRYGTESPKFQAPGGGRVGMATTDIQRLYSGRIEEQPHKYTDGRYLRIKDAATENALLFETDAAGKVTEWRVGMPPQLDYVEGCS